MDPISLMGQFTSNPAFAADDPANGFKLLVEPIPHRRYREAMFRMAELHHQRRTHGVGGGLLLTAPSGAGKSTLLAKYAESFPRDHEATRTKSPVILTTVPSSPTSSSLMGAMLEALGQRQKSRRKDSAADKTAELTKLVKECGVEMILLNEFQHLLFTHSLTVFRDVTDNLKLFLEDSNVGVVACGIPEAELAVQGNIQLTRRFSERIRITPFKFDDDEDFREFRGVLKAYEAKLPLATEIPLYEANLARRFHVGSYGLLDYVVKILEGAVSVAATAGLTSIDLPALAAGFRNRIWKDVPDRLNPFHPDSPLRPLDRAGEVFYQHGKLDLGGSPVARSLGMSLSKGGSRNG